MREWEVAYTGLAVVVDPLDACGVIKSNLTDAIAIINKNDTDTNCNVAKQVLNVDLSKTD